MKLAPQEHPQQATANKFLIGLIGLYVALLPFPITIEMAGESQIRTGPSDVVLLVLLVFGGSRLSITREAWSRWHTAAAFVPLASGLIAAAQGYTVTVAVIAAKIVGLLGLFLLYLIIVNFIQTWNDIRLVARWFVVSVVWVNIVATVAFVLRIQALGLNIEPARLSGLNPDPNAYGGLLIVALALAIPTMRSEKPLVTGRLTQFGLLLVPLSIFLTNSRSAWIAVGVGFIVIASAMPRAWFRFALVTTLAIAALAAFLPTELATDQIALAGRGSSARFEILDYALEAFWSSPLIGIGLGQYAAQHGYIVHSTVLWWLGEFGFVGLVVSSGFLFTFARWGWKVYRTQMEPNRSLILGILAAFIAMSVFSLGIEALYQRWWWLTMALIGSARIATAAEIRSARDLRDTATALGG